jgi:hypothetical protein
MQEDWRICLSVQRSYSISVDEWSDQPLVPALVFLSVWQAKNSNNGIWILHFTRCRNLKILHGCRNLNLFSTSWSWSTVYWMVSGWFRFDDISGSDCLLGVPPIDHLPPPLSFGSFPLDTAWCLMRQEQHLEALEQCLSDDMIKNYWADTERPAIISV